VNAPFFGSSRRDWTPFINAQFKPYANLTRYGENYNHSIVIYDYIEKKVINKLFPFKNENDCYLGKLRFSQDGKYFAVVNFGKENNVLLFEYPGKHLMTFKGTDRTFYINDKYLFINNPFECIHLETQEKLDIVSNISKLESNHRENLKISKDLKFVVLKGPDTIMLCNMVIENNSLTIKKNRIIKIDRFLPQWPLSYGICEFSNSGRFLLVESDNKINEVHWHGNVIAIYDLHNDEQVKLIDHDRVSRATHYLQIQKVTFSNDDKYIGTSGGKSWKIWSLESGKIIDKVSSVTEQSNSIRFSNNDNRYIAMGDNYGNIELFKIV